MRGLKSSLAAGGIDLNSLHQRRARPLWLRPQQAEPQRRQRAQRMLPQSWPARTQSLSSVNTDANSVVKLFSADGLRNLIGGGRLRSICDGLIIARGRAGGLGRLGRGGRGRGRGGGHLGGSLGSSHVVRGGLVVERANFSGSSFIAVSRCRQPIQYQGSGS